MRPTEKMIEAAAAAMWAGRSHIPWADIFPRTQEHYREGARTALSAALAVEAGADAEWTYQIQHGPDGEANYAWVYRGQEMVATMKTHHARAVCSALTPASSAVEGEAVRIADAVLSWMVKYDLLDAGNEYRAEDIVSVLDDLAPASPAPHQEDRANG